MNGYTKEQEKSAREREIFLEFAGIASLDIDPNSVQSPAPPEPDIKCAIQGVIHYFELCEITSESVARSIARSLKTGDITGGAFSQEEPIVHCLIKKASRHYQVRGVPLEVLLYYDKQVRPPSAPQFLRTYLRNTAEAMHRLGRWRQVWVYDRWKKQILVRLPENMS